MNPAERLEDHHPGVLYEVVQAGHQEEVVHQNSLTIPQFTLRTVEIKVYVQILYEGCDGILIGVGLLLDNLDQILHHVPPVNRRFLKHKTLM